MMAGAKNRSALAAYAVAYIVFLYLPVVLLPLFSFNQSITPSFPLTGFTTDWYLALADEPEMHNALINSLKADIARLDG